MSIQEIRGLLEKKGRITSSDVSFYLKITHKEAEEILEDCKRMKIVVENGRMFVRGDTIPVYERNKQNFDKYII